MEQTKAIVCNALTKNYGKNNGLFDCNLQVNEGEVFGLIGPNGAGKSTLIKLLMDLVKPTSGSAKIFGKDAQKDSIEIKSLVGYLPGELMQFPGVTVKYILNLLMNLRGIADKSEILRISTRLNLDISRKFSDLSHGNKQKVGLVQAFMHKPRILILDEPTLGLDPLIQRELQQMMKEYTAKGNTVVLSSHVLSEVESMCHRIGLIHRGEIRKLGTLEELRSSRIHKINLILSGDLPTRADIEAHRGEQVAIDGKNISFQIRGSFDPVLKLLSKYQVLEFDSRELSLEEVFFSEVSPA